MAGIKESSPVVCPTPEEDPTREAAATSLGDVYLNPTFQDNPFTIVSAY
jgi:hypothetical protein